jgi:hypothetical protein
MNQEIKDRWLAKLADPDNYPQGINRLHSSTGKFCCWGVLCEVAVEDGFLTSWEHRAAGSFIYAPVDDEHNSMSGYPNAVVLEWAEISPLEVVPDQNIVDHLANANDNGSNFAYIANEIRERM